MAKAKKVANILKLQIPAGAANPSPPVGPALGQVGVNIMDFCNAFNAETQSAEKGLPLPVVITVYEDKAFTFVVKTPPAAVLIRKALGIPSAFFINTAAGGVFTTNVKDLSSYTVITTGRGSPFSAL